jgi:hypothetical protein
MVYNGLTLTNIKVKFYPLLSNSYLKEQVLSINNYEDHNTLGH